MRAGSDVSTPKLPKMKLPAIPFLTKSVSTEFFLALIFETDKISSILFKEQEKTLIILGSHETVIDLEASSAEDLVVSCDNVISRLEMSLPEGANLEKTIFAVPHSWVEEGKIKAERLAQLKKISTELALVPMGFIISIEAIVAFLQKKEGAPISGIFVEISEKYLTAFIVRNGNIIDIKNGMIEDSVEATVEKLLGRVTKLDVLPSKIILLHNKEAEAVSQKFLSHHWTKNLPFQHLPQVAILERGFENEAIINGVATQLNVTVKGDVDIITSDAPMTDSDTKILQSKGTFGFVQDQDLAGEVDEKPVRKAEKKDIPVFTEEIEHSDPIIKHHDVVRVEQNGGEEVFEEDMSEESETHGQTKAFPLANIISSVPALFTPQAFANIPRMLGSGRKLVIPLVALVVVLLVITAYYAFILKASVIIFTDKKAFAQDSMDITLTSKGESSFSKKTLKVSTLDEEVSGEETQETTGQKDTGQKAAGTITIFNKTEGSRQIDKGTTVTSSNNLAFTLNENVNVASTSSFATSFSNAQVKVSASNFGKEFNLPSQTNFTIKGIATSDLFGRNEGAFSGGTKEEIQVVALKDIKGLEDTVTKRLFEKAKSVALTKLSADDALVPTYLSADFKDKTFDKKENDQAKNVKLTATVDYTLGIYKKEELSKFISSSSDFNVPKDFKLSDSESTIKISDIQQNKDDISAKLSYNAVFKPEFDEKTIPKEIAGKSQNDAITKLKTTPGVSDATIVFANSIPFLPLFVPLNKANISVSIKSQ